MHTDKHAHPDTQRLIDRQAHTEKCIQMHMNKNMHADSEAYRRADTVMYTKTHTDAYANMWPGTNRHTEICTHTQTCTHTQNVYT